MAAVANPLSSEPGLRRTPGGAGASGAVVLHGSWTVGALAPRLREIERRLRAEAPAEEWDARGVDALDTTGAAVLWKGWGRRRPPQLLVGPHHAVLFERLAADRPIAPPPPRGPRPAMAIATVGQTSLELLGHLRDLVTLAGQIVLDALGLARTPRRGPWRDATAALYHAGPTALPVTAMVGFLIGIVVSYLSAQQIRTFGANVLIVNLLGISVLRELGPLLAAIIVAGRSGSAMTAQIGVMHVTQELDALSALGISRTRRLVLPRVIALAVALPLLVVWTDVMALWGGIVASKVELGIGLAQFLERLPAVVPAVNLWIGVAKGAVFGALIGLVACHFGLRVEPNTESVGSGTTSSVVAAITLVLVADALFAIALSEVGLEGTFR
jgi:phospholipid/cholesterol/gamma-HCH transport system permease protein